MRLKIYNSLVNKHTGIRQRYHAMHDNSSGIVKALSWLYLLWLNFAFYCLFQKWLAKDKGVELYESKSLKTDAPESGECPLGTPEQLVEKLSKFDVISFDIFDTLIFRPFSAPTDLFFLIGQRLSYMDFKRIRVEAEHKSRMEQFNKNGTFEVTLEDIWATVSEMTGLDAEKGVALETEIELSMCYANSYMRNVFDALVSMGKHIVITSDMYLTKDLLEKILSQNGYKGYDELYVSCEIDLGKSDGQLFDYVRDECIEAYGKNITFAHIGDNEVSDVKNADSHGFKAFHYPNVNKNTIMNRTFDMSPIIGGAYRGVVNNRLYAGMDSMNMNQEFGFIYGGLFVMGYCNYIHDYVESHNIDKVMFLSRDGEIIKRIYDNMYPDDDTCYAYISRLAAAKLSAGYLKYDFLRKMVYHKATNEKTMSQVLEAMELPDLKIKNGRRKLHYGNVNSFIDFLNENWDSVLETYKPQREAAGEWYRELIGEAKSAVVVDIGWAGSGYLALKNLFEKEWNIDCQLTGIVAGTNTANNAEPDMSETMLLDGSMLSYLYSSMDNRDLYKKHDPAKDYNLYFELITSSPSPSFKGFYYDENGEIELRFSKPEDNPEGIKDIWDGIEKFVNDYRWHFSDYEYMFNISGRDAYAPMLLAASHNEKYLKTIYKNFDLKVAVE
ncbi:HAD family hydrolase [Pseudobutyrivibrio xylanivorans]|uniref:Haloacid dehalogenase-like hydrolase n=1 Tax=Pseudobutyrivibrio xylanivorans DSM 14809 TaxID=1123012 RepID=A0A1M6JAH2_PSEXY|nr:hypothetical protein [Pseudobutyrivibrio xylanivorans]SHJ43640.1 hypothetical protein SAMN02745725_02541 [Pseudobutyrivibrio xylanivorans DSM 14809]